MFSIDPADQRTEENGSEYELYSDRITRIAPTYKIARNENLKLYPGPDTPTVNLKQLMELLLSKDLSRNSELDFVSENNFRFLDGQNIDGWHTVFSSFPRSGNTMLRKWIEQLTGLTTGADADLLTVLDLQGMGMFGECHKGSD